jgi:hypothetical protein
MLGDGLAYSVSTSNTGVGLVICGNGSAMSSEQTTISIIPTPMDSSVVSFDERIKVQQKGTQIINYISPTVQVNNATKYQKLFSITSSSTMNNMEKTFDVIKSQPVFINKIDCQVLSNDNKGNYIAQFLALDPSKAKPLQVTVVQYEQKIIFTQPKIHTGFKPSNIKVTNQRKGLVVKVSKMSYRALNLQPLNVLVQKGTRPLISLPVLNMPTLHVAVEGYKNPLNASTSSGNGLNSFVIEMQPQSYYKFALTFNQGVVITDITGLPQGMFVEKQYLKGSPKINGEFTVSVKLSDGSTLSGMLIVTPIPRQL